MLTQYIEEAKKRAVKKLSWLPRYCRPIQINEDYSKRDESADVIDMLEDSKVKDIIQSFLESELTALHDKVREEIAGEIEKMKKCVFESDGEKHSCYNECDGTVENCTKCHKDICSNKLCPNGKADNGYNEYFNQAVDLAVKIARGKK